MIMHDMESMGRRQSSWWTQLNPAEESSGTRACDISFTRRNQCDMQCIEISGDMKTSSGEAALTKLV